MPDICDVIIVGGGPAGLSAALVLGRARRHVVVVDAGNPRNSRSEHLHGYLSRDGASPGDVLARGRDEVKGYGVEIVSGSVSDIDQSEDALTVTLHGGETRAGRRLVLALGTTDDLPDIPGLEEGWGTDVLHCPYCHGHEMSDRPLVVLATRPGAAHQAKMVRQWSGDVVMITNETADLTDGDRRDLRQRGIGVVDGRVAEIEREDGVLQALRLTTGERIAAEAVFVVPHMQPPSDLVERLGLEVQETPMGPCVKVGDNGRTSVRGVWAAGNIADPSAQVVTAASDGALAAMDVNADLVDAGP